MFPQGTHIHSPSLYYYIFEGNSILARIYLNLNWQSKWRCLDIHFYTNNNNISNSFLTTVCRELNYISLYYTLNENCFEIHDRNKLTVALLLANFSILSWTKRFLHRSLPSRKHRRSHRQFCKGCKNSKGKFFSLQLAKTTSIIAIHPAISKRNVFWKKMDITVYKYSHCRKLQGNLPSKI